MATQTQTDHRRAVAIAAVGLITPFGRGVEPLWRGLCAGESRFDAWNDRDEAGDAGIRSRAAAVPDELLDDELAADDRCVALCAAALNDLRQQDRGTRGLLDSIDPTRLGACVASTQGAVRRWEREQRQIARGQRGSIATAVLPSPPHSNDPLLAVARGIAASGPLANPALACTSGTAAVGIAADWIRSGRCDAAVAGGVDALSLFVHRGFAALRAVDPVSPHPFDVDRAGMGLGEAAALLLLTSVDQAADDATRIAGWGLACDAMHLTAPDPTGAGLARAIVAALGDAGDTVSGDARQREELFVNAHGTGTVFNDLMEARALRAALGEDLARSVPVNAVKGAVGHTLAAAGALEAVVCQLILERALVPATIGCRRIDPAIPLDVVCGEPRPGRRSVALSTAAGFGGINAALLLVRD